MNPMGQPMRVGSKPAEMTEEALEDGEGVGPDLLDFLTPRDIALDRYVRHHEWLEEIISSPYDTHRIVPPVLGMGRAGELQSLTADFFDTPEYEEEVGRILPDPDFVDRKKVYSDQPVVEEVPIPRVGRLEGTKAEDFTKRATERVAEVNAEMEALKLKHAKEMERFKETLVFAEAAEKVRFTGLDFIKGEEVESTAEREKEIEELQISLAETRGKKIRFVPIVECTEKGGQEEMRQPTPMEVLPQPKEPQDSEMTGTDTPDLDGARLATPPEPTKQPDAIPKAQSVSAEQPPAPEVQAETSPKVSQTVQGGESQPSVQQPEKLEAAAEDYVMVSREDVPPPEAQELAKPVASPKQPDVFDQGNSGLDSLDFGDSHQDDFAPVDFGDDGLDFGDMNTAGDELSSYAQDIANMGGAASEHSNTGFDSPFANDGGQQDQQVPQ